MLSVLATSVTFQEPILSDWREKGGGRDGKGGRRRREGGKRWRVSHLPLIITSAVYDGRTKKLILSSNGNISE